MYYITINVQYVRYSTGRKIKYFIVYRLSRKRRQSRYLSHRKKKNEEIERKGGDDNDSKKRGILSRGTLAP
jgi:hypothetical protein